MTGEEFRARREAMGLSQRQLAVLLGVGQETIGRWERGDLSIRWPTVFRLALDAIESRLAQGDLLPPSPLQRD